MAKYKLTYFDFPGSRGEECRLALSVNNVEFEDHRIQRNEWANLKPTTPFGTLPTLEREGSKTLAQVNAILSYIGASYGHHPSDAWDAARHEAIFAYVEELRGAIAPTGETKDEDEKKRRRQAFAEGYLQRWCHHIEQQIAGPLLESERLHLADIKLFVICEALMNGAYDHIDASVFSPFPKLCSLHRAVAEHPKVRAWRER